MVTSLLRCKVCDGIMEIDDDREILSCPYCGSKELFLESDDVKKARIRSKTKLKERLGVKEIEKDIQLGKEQIKREMARDALIFEERKLKIGDIDTARTFVFVLICLFFLFMAAIIGSVQERGTIQVGSSSKELIGENYEYVAGLLSDAGFLKVDLYPMGDLKTINLFVKENSVDQITIGGKNNFSERDRFSPESTVRIYYHSFPE